MLVTYLPDCVLQKVMVRVGLKRFAVLGQSNKDMYARTKPVLEAIFAERIQRFWRWCRLFSSTNVLVKRFQGARLPPTVMMSTVFDQFVVHLREKRVLIASQLFIARIYTQCKQSSPLVLLDEGQGAAAKVNVRVFLGAYMIKYHPTCVFERMGELELELAAVTDALLLSLDTIVARIAETKSFTGVSTALSGQFLAHVHEYLRVFDLWKDPDAERLAGRICRAIMTYYRLTPTHQAADQGQMQRLRNRLVKISGVEALARLDAELEAAGLIPVAAVGGHASDEEDDA